MWPLTERPNVKSWDLGGNSETSRVIKSESGFRVFMRVLGSTYVLPPCTGSALKFWKQWSNYRNGGWRQSEVKVRVGVEVSSEIEARLTYKVKSRFS